ncbi:MAG: hypothetical protein J7647_22785 [Cyanobacteria bacterium SBLK]|nr:hypothetical protein [Cyanobacteria bacterium SBLK]
MQIGNVRFSQPLTTLAKVVTASFFVFVVTPIVEASDRYPTEVEMQQLRSQLSRRIQELRSGEFRVYLDDYRTEEERQQYQAFVNAWSQVDPAVTPFLGMWVGYEQTVSIYPSDLRGRVCIIGNNEVGFSGFATGEVMNNTQIRTSDREFIIRSSDYLGIAGIYNGQPFIGDEIPYKNPIVPSLPNRLGSEDPELARQAERALQQFKEEGCLASLPTSDR